MSRTAVLKCRILSFFKVSILFLLIAASPSAIGNEVTLAWDANTDKDLAGYNLYYGTKSRNYVEMIDVGSATSATVDQLEAGNTYYFAVTAYSTAGLESDYSLEISFPVPHPPSPTTEETITEEPTTEEPTTEEPTTEEPTTEEPTTEEPTTEEPTTEEPTTEEPTTEEPTTEEPTTEEPTTEEPTTEEPTTEEPTTEEPSSEGEVDSDNHAPTARDGEIMVYKIETESEDGEFQQASVFLYAQDEDRDPLSYEIVQQPEHGDLSGVPPFQVYTPDSTFQTNDQFVFRVNDGKEYSGEASVNVIGYAITGEGLQILGSTQQLQQSTSRAGSSAFGFEITKQAIPGVQYALQVSTDLKTWETIHVPERGRPLMYIDQEAADPDRRRAFYRVLMRFPTLLDSGMEHDLGVAQLLLK